MHFTLARPSPSMYWTWGRSCLTARTTRLASQVQHRLLTLGCNNFENKKLKTKHVKHHLSSSITIFYLQPKGKNVVTLEIFDSQPLPDCGPAGASAGSSSSFDPAVLTQVVWSLNQLLPWMMLTLVLRIVLTQLVLAYQPTACPKARTVPHMPLWKKRHPQQKQHLRRLPCMNMFKTWTLKWLLYPMTTCLRMKSPLLLNPSWGAVTNKMQWRTTRQQRKAKARDGEAEEEGKDEAGARRERKRRLKQRRRMRRMRRMRR